MENDLKTRLQAALEALSRMQDQRDQLAVQLKDATSQCVVQASLLRDSQRYVRYHLEHTECDARIVMGLISDIDSALSGKLSVPAVEVTETIRTAPERIWLQVGDQSHYHSDPFPRDNGDVTWCADSVVGCEVPYVRADLAGKSTAVTEGWQLVPVEPNYAMLAEDGCKEHAEGQKCVHHDNRRRIWAAMLAAAPKPKGGA